MATNFDFSQLIEEHHTFTDADGSVYEFRNQSDFGTVEMARARRMQNHLPALAKRLESNPDDVQAATQLEQISRAMLDIILPDLPQERRDELTIGQTMAIVNFWVQQQRQKNEGEAAADPAS